MEAFKDRNNAIVPYAKVEYLYVNTSYTKEIRILISSKERPISLWYNSAKEAQKAIEHFEKWLTPNDIKIEQLPKKTLEL